MRKLFQWTDNQTELLELAAEIKARIYLLMKDAQFLESLVSAIRTSEDFINCSKCLMSIHKKISGTIHSLQAYSISSLRIIGLEIGPLRIILPWTFNLNLGTTHRKKVLDSLLQELQSVLWKCVSLQSTLLKLENIHSPKDINLIDLSNQSNWSSEIMKEVIRALETAADENQDNLLILQNLIEWDYNQRFTVGDCDNEDDDKPIGINPLPKWQEQSVGSRLFRKLPEMPSSSKIRYPYQCLKRSLFGSMIFMAFILMSFTYLA